MTLKTKNKLIHMYDNLNKKYWNNELPVLKIEIKETKNCYGEYHEPKSKKDDTSNNYKIVINARLHWRNKESMRSTLLHEMCHHSVFLKHKEKYWNKEILWHGKEWRREMEKVGFKKPIRKDT